MLHIVPFDYIEDNARNTIRKIMGGHFAQQVCGRRNWLDSVFHENNAQARKYGSDGCVALLLCSIPHLESLEVKDNEDGLPLTEAILKRARSSSEFIWPSKFPNLSNVVFNGRRDFRFDSLPPYTHERVTSLTVNSTAGLERADFKEKVLHIRCLDIDQGDITFPTLKYLCSSMPRLENVSIKIRIDTTFPENELVTDFGGLNRTVRSWTDSLKDLQLHIDFQPPLPMIRQRLFALDGFQHLEKVDTIGHMLHGECVTHRPQLQ